MQWLPTRFYGSLSVYSRPLPSEKIAPIAAQLKIAFRRFLLILDLPDFAVERNVKSEIGFVTLVTLVTFRQRVQYARQPLKK